ncbi:formimidoylglutamate deiminase [Pseudoxanthomonas indica]|uniref:Formimidoylglutamate deiminase n=1 Tax=Pseudoxanthomonas indica TaxID=428993 RepID=A0A1T5LNR5_9GAMM|nr:formimidoylglutamate deiminase [Pseudoxanthomonas indica]GGD37380.1 formimidoylglutamate deiminase [Pseudoxanthomonas indica]SKC77515.1 formimidoylglutamate deiminase [Pseudoxanthomonas indica]
MDKITGQLWTPVGWTDDSRFSGYAVPGIANLHSHAFQRAMAGLAERQTHPEDSFWTWRETMYRFAARMNPDSLYAVARQLYVEMLEAGYTSVCEFHYLHHAPDGRPYAEPAAMSLALIAAARDTGIRMTLLPVLYMSGGFDGRPLSERQRRFGHSVESFLSLLARLQPEQDERLRIGVALHSLRAVPAASMHEVLAELPGDMRVHIHIAEQIGEVQDCLSLRGARPVEWLLANARVDTRWTLVHATHLTEAETVAIADSGATVAICPTTEANLGDGLFPFRDYLDAEGRWGIGSDSHISVSPVEELRWLEYGQRLITRHRNIAVQDSNSVGESLLHGVVASAAASTGLSGEGDYVVLDDSAPLFAGAHAQDVVDRWIFSGNRPAVREVHVGHRRVVEAGRHAQHAVIASEYQRTLRALLADA